MRINLYNRQKLGILRKNSPRRKVSPKEDRGQTHNEDTDFPVKNKDTSDVAKMVNSSVENKSKKETRFLPLIPKTNNQLEFGTTEDND